ncbi:MBL fold metallo-hydrolase [Persicitalea jodogahamensis]|uniref:MBL fold metallo-hydrolase n=1 Tax=Persicitalea jodogahamensis TaxID=402147 RepID=A0A8J3D7J9_9BACT|nr:MBL fold metallo-hydrolase [Persicitalea jodogahamensis]GHB72362.1 MBL fold metallo-hydrolase [Persicitalea jodogahamensis]
MKIHVINTGLFKLDGGAMFGVVPKVLWQKQHSADANNLCTWAMRCLLIEDGDRLILIDTGMGDKQSEKFFSYYEPHGYATLPKSIGEAGFRPEDVTDVILTHLHFDHVGGAVVRRDEQLKLTFPNATYWSEADHWQWALDPNPRERASFLKENILPIQESGQLKFIEDSSPFLHIDFIKVKGHTEQMMLPVIHYKEKTLIYAADLIPSTAHVPLPWVMAYDVRPLLTMEEKDRVLNRALDENAILIFEHDPVYEAAILEKNEKGIRIKERGALEDFLLNV